MKQKVKTIGGGILKLLALVIMLGTIIGVGLSGGKYVALVKSSHFIDDDSWETVEDVLADYFDDGIFPKWKHYIDEEGRDIVTYASELGGTDCKLYFFVVEPPDSEECTALVYDMRLDSVSYGLEVASILIDDAISERPQLDWSNMLYYESDVWSAEDEANEDGTEATITDNRYDGAIFDDYFDAAYYDWVFAHYVEDGYLPYGFYGEGYAFPSEHYCVTDAFLAGLTQEQVVLLRNEIYARYGYIFSTPWIYDYFYEKDWYYPTMEPAEFHSGFFTDIPWENMNRITAFEEAQGWR